MTKHIHGGDVYKYDHCLDFSANCNPLGTPQWNSYWKNRL